MKRSGIIRYPAFIEVSYRKFLLSLVSDINKDVRFSIMDNSYFKSSYNLFVKQDDTLEDIEKLIDNLKVKFLSGFLMTNLVLTKKSIEISNFNLRSITNALPSYFSKSVKVITQKLKELMRLWVIENSRLIKSINSKFLDDVAISVYEAVKTGLSVSSLARNIERNYQVTKARAKLIAVDQVAKLNGALTRQRKLDLGLTDYVWVTSNDERVRKSHKVLEGKVCNFNNNAIFKDSVDDKTWDKRVSIGGDLNHPGFAIRCRCTSYSIYD